jgi:hypothetical protein
MIYTWKLENGAITTATTMKRKLRASEEGLVLKEEDLTAESLLGIK